MSNQKDEPFNILLKKLASPVVKIRLEAAAALNLAAQKLELTDDQNITMLIKAMKDPNAEVRALTAETLGYLGSVKANPILLEALSDTDPNVRAEAVWALGELGLQESMPNIVNTLKDTDKAVKWNAVEALEKLANIQTIEPLLDAINDNDKFVRRKIALVLSKMRVNNEPILDLFIKLLNDEDSQLRKQAANTLGQLGNVNAIKPLIDTLNDPSLEVQRDAIIAIGKIGDETILPILIQIAQNPDNDISHLKNKKAALMAINNIQAIHRK